MPSAHLLISDFPGKEEDRVGYPLVGRLGKEVRRMFNMDPDIPNFDEWRSENLIREYRPDSKDYSEADVERDGPELRRAIEATNPSTIVTMGRFSARFLLGDVDLDGAHSMPWAVDGRTVISLYNPAAGWKSPDIQARVSYGFGQLAGYFRGEITPKVYGADAFAGRERYVEILSPSDIRLDPDLPIYIDSEGWAARPWSVQYSQRPGEGYLIDASRLDCIATFRTQLRGIPERGIRGPRIVYHSALHDLSVLRAMGIETADLPFGDTQVQSYLLQVEPLGLKPLAARHAGMAMSSYDDLTGGIGDELARDYAVSLYDIEQADYEIRQAAALTAINATPLYDAAGNARRGKDGNIRYRRVTKPPTVSKSRLHAASQRLLRSPNPRKLWGNQDDDIQVAAYNRLGPLDQPTLDHVDRRDAVYYASRDPDATGRVDTELSPRIDSMGLRGVYNLELGTYPLIDRMGAVGLRPDLRHFESLSGKLQVEIDNLQSELDSLTNREAFNANSGDQVRTLLFDELGLPGSKRTASGDWSTNDKILEGLEREFGTRYPVVSTIRSFRETYKLKNTFVDRIPDFTRRWPSDGRIHATFRTTRVVTGRLAASDPNILAMPKHGKFAPEFRAGFVADSGHVLASWDQCLVPGTRVLKADLTWVPIEQLSVGDKLVGIEEYTTNGKERKTLTTDVRRLAKREKESYEIFLSNGKKITASSEHPWLVKVKNHGVYKWVETSTLQVGDRLSRFVDPWETEDTWDAGWLAGFFDGEGSLSIENGTMVLTQNPGPLMEKAKTLLRSRGYDFHVDNPRTHASGFGGRRTEVLWLTGVRDIMHFLGTIRPHRLLLKAEGLWDGRISLKTKRGKATPVDSSPVFVVRIAPVGLKTVIAMETGSHTFVAEGFHTHNSQIELRVLSHLSQDPVLLAAYRDGIDLHAKLAQRIFGGVEADYKKGTGRLAAKAVNFGLPMGMTRYGLAIELRKNGLSVDEDDAQRWIDETDALYTGVPIYKARMIAEARRNGFIRCLSGRIRYIGGIRSGDEFLREEAARFAFSTPVQEGAQWIMKQAEIRVWNDVILPFQRQGHWIEPIVQVHDDLVLEADDDPAFLLELNTAMRWAMTEAPERISVPLDTSGDAGPNWRDMEPIVQEG